jgi:hypothetical protein
MVRKPSNAKYCDKEHRYHKRYKDLPRGQGGHGRHHCAGCAYEAGYKAGLERQEDVMISLKKLPKSQAGSVRHRSPHAAWALGYLHGVEASYE